MTGEKPLAGKLLLSGCRCSAGSGPVGYREGAEDILVVKPVEQDVELLVVPEGVTDGCVVDEISGAGEVGGPAYVGG